MSGIGPGHALAATRSSVALIGRPQTRVPWVAVTDPGCARRHNEDRFQVDDTHGVFALADGMGGHHAGEVASEIAVRTVVQAVGALQEAGLSSDDALDRAVRAAHAGIIDFAQARPDCLGMGTTLVAAAIDFDRLTVAHVGDSRAYRWRAGVLDRLTADHSIGQQMLDTGRLTPAEVGRLPARGILTRALGVAGEALRADLAVLDWRAGDLLLLCSDGLTDPLDDAAIGRVFARARRSLPMLAQELIAAALAAGCADNVTVLLAGGSGAGFGAH